MRNKKILATFSGKQSLPLGCRNRNILGIARRVPRILTVFFVFFALATVFLAIESSAYGAQLVSLEAKSASIESQNQELRSALVTSTSLAKIAEDAQKLGMVKPEKLTYISGEKPVARIP